MPRLGVNIDHIATLRNARKEVFPNVVEAALVAESSGADFITVHLREDRRHINDKDLSLLKQTIKSQLNLEIALTEEMLKIASQIKPDFVCFVPEKRQEVTTEGGLDIINNFDKISKAIELLNKINISVSLFVDPDVQQIEAAYKCHANLIEIHTGKYAQLKDNYLHSSEFKQLKDACKLAHSLNLKVNLGHGINYNNVLALTTIPQINDFNIGFAIIAKSLFVGLPNAVMQMKKLICGLN